MGTVYLARDRALSRWVAIKVIVPHLLTDDSMVSRFRLEAQTVASLRHANIVDIYSVRHAGDLHYFVMEFIDGPTLRSLIQDHAPLDIPVVQALLFQVGSALAYAHRTGRGVIHRDVKPANIIVDHEGSAFVMDFGIAKITASEGRLTQTGATVGTPEYMSPEQCRGDELTGASDQYSLGIVGYELLCGGPPFDGSPYTIMEAHSKQPPPPIRTARPDCPPEVATAIERMLSKSVDDRWPDVHQAVLAAGGGPTDFHHPTRHAIAGLVSTSQGSMVGLDASSPLSPAPQRRPSGSSITVTGVPARVEAGDTFDLAVHGSAGAGEPTGGLTPSWSSSDPSVATVEGGRVTAHRSGTAVIEATAAQASTRVLIHVGGTPPRSVRVIPESLGLREGQRGTLRAALLDEQGRELERPVRWQSSDPAIAAVTPDGKVISRGQGALTVTAESGGVRGSAEIQIGPAARWATVWLPRVALFAAVLVGAYLGVRGLVPGGEGPTASPVVDRVDVVGATQPLQIGEVVGLSAVGLDAASLPVDLPVVWESSDRFVAAIDAAGEVTANGPGEAQIRATVGGVTAQTSVVVLAAPPNEPEPEDPPALPNRASGGPDGPPGPVRAEPSALPARLLVDFETTTLRVGERLQAFAQVTDAQGRPVPPADYQLAWTSSLPTTLSVGSTSGTVAAVEVGSSYIVASVGVLRDSVMLTSVSAATSVVVQGSDAILQVGEVTTLRASVLDVNGRPLDDEITWRSGDASIASVDPTTGRVSGLLPGSTTITASSGFLSDIASVTVTPLPPSQDEIAGELTRYTALVGAGASDSVTAYWRMGDGDGSLRAQFLELIGSAETASLESTAPATTEGTTVFVPFEVNAEVETGFGPTRTRTLSLSARFEWQASGWRLASCWLVALD